MTLTATHGTLTLGRLAGLTFLTGDGTADADLTFTGTLPDLNAALERLTFTPTANYHGAAQVQLTTNDLGHAGLGPALTASDTVVLDIRAVNDAPVGAADQLHRHQGSSVAVAWPGVLANDTDVDGDRLTLAVVQRPTNGQLSLAADGAFTYTPRLDFVGTDTFSYAAYDGQASSAPVTVTLVIRPTVHITSSGGGEGGGTGGGSGEIDRRGGSGSDEPGTGGSGDLGGSGANGAGGSGGNTGTHAGRRSAGPAWDQRNRSGCRGFGQRDCRRPSAAGGRSPWWPRRSVPKPRTAAHRLRTWTRAGNTPLAAHGRRAVPATPGRKAQAHPMPDWIRHRTPGRRAGT